MALNIIFAGTSDFAVPSLTALAESDHKIVAVYTRPDRPAGRGRKIRQSPVKKLAVQLQLPLYQPKTLKNSEVQTELKRHNADVMVVASYGLILPQEVLNIPRLGCINIHASLLPRWRGAAPIERAMLAGDSETGITIMQMNQGLDTGDMLYQESCVVSADDTAASLHDKLAAIGAQSIVKTLELLLQGKIKPEQQNHDLATYADKISKEEAELNWHLTADELSNRIRAFNPRPVAYTFCDDIRIRIWHAVAVPGRDDYTPGTIIALSSDGLDVATSKGALRITDMQLPSKKTQNIKDIKNANYPWLQPGKLLGT